MNTVIQIGWRAAEILAGGASDARVLAPTSASIYIVVAGQILWLGGPTDLMHPRAIVLSEPPNEAACIPGDPISMPPWTTPVWRPEPLSPRPGATTALRRGARRLGALAASLGTPHGFGARLIDQPLTFPLAGAGKDVDTLTAACARNDAAAAAEAASALIGLGGGLTPSGDDFVGGAFFARAVLAHLDGSATDAWHRAAARVLAVANDATNPISAALLGDLVEGHGWSALHDLVSSLVVDDDLAAMHAASRLVRLGHSSGWDVLAGFVGGLG